MSDPSPVEARDEKVEGAPEVSYESGQGIDSIEQKLNGTSADPFPPRTLIIKRRAKRKDDGPLEIVCGFIVEHQIGIMKTFRPSRQTLAD
jgi:acyl-CoA-dependent ceramide synthase